MTSMPSTVTDWIKSLPAREGWQGWDTVSNTVYEGVQNWSENGDEHAAVGVWGNVTLPLDDEPSEVQWCVYVGDSREPERCGFEDAGGAMRWAEQTFPDRFNASPDA